MELNPRTRNMLSMVGVDAPEQRFQFRNYETAGYGKNISSENVDSLKSNIMEQTLTCPAEGSNNDKNDCVHNFSSEEEFYDSDKDKEFVPSGSTSSFTDDSDSDNEMIITSSSGLSAKVINNESSEMRTSSGMKNISSDVIESNSPNESNFSTFNTTENLQKPITDNTTKNLLGMNSSEHTSQMMVDDLHTIKQKKKTVPTSTTIGTHTKNFFCIFCKKLVTRFGRHITTFHKTENRVLQILAYPTKHDERKTLINKLRNEGTLIYNNDQKFNTGQLIVTRRPNKSKKRSDKDYLPCPFCFAYYISKNLYRHKKHCYANKTTRNDIKSQANDMQISMNMNDLSLDQNTSKLLNNLKNDEIAHAIKTDYLLLRHASFLCSKYCTEKHLRNHARQKLRQLARLFLTVKEKTPEITSFQDCFQPKYFGRIIAGVQTVCKFDYETGIFEIPSMADHLGIYLKESANVLLTLCIMNHDEEKKKAETSYTQLNDFGYCYSAWRTLLETTAVIILIFNRKRPGETQQILLKSYYLKQTIENNSDDYKTLTTLEKLLSNTFKRIEIRGKRDRRIPILLRENHIRYIDKFLEFRENAEVPKENEYLFGVDGKNCIRLTDVVRRESGLCGAQQPNRLRATSLRKQVATTSQLLSLNDNEMQLLADFMGHDLAIHKVHYRTPELTLQIAKLSKMLIAVDEGNLVDYKGKTLEELDVQRYLNDGDENETAEDLMDTEIGKTEYSRNEKILNPTTFETDNMNSGNNISVDEPNFQQSKILANTKILKSPVKKAYHRHNLTELQNEKTYSRPTTASVHSTTSPKDSSNIFVDEPNLQQSTVPVNIEIPKSPVKKAVHHHNLSELQNEKTYLRATTASVHFTTPPKDKPKINRVKWRTPEKRAVRTLFHQYFEKHILPSEAHIKEKVGTIPELKNRTAIQIKAWISNEIKRNKACRSISFA